MVIQAVIAMLLKEGNNQLENSFVEEVPQGLPREGDIRFLIQVTSFGFSGSACVWTDPESNTNFLDQLKVLEHSRRGHAEWHAVGSPDEFHLTFRVLDRSGHMAVMGRLLQSHIFEAIQDEANQAVEFAFEFCPSRLPEVLKGFERLTKNVPRLSDGKGADSSR